MPSSRKRSLSERDRIWWRVDFESIKQIPSDEWIKPSERERDGGHGRDVTEQYMLFGRGLHGQ